MLITEIYKYTFDKIKIKKKENDNNKILHRNTINITILK